MGEQVDHAVGLEFLSATEAKAEHIPTLEEVLNVMEKMTDSKVLVTHYVTDAVGVFLLNATIPKMGSNPGERTAFEYMRASKKGEHPEGSSTETAIHIVYYEGDSPESEIPVGGTDLASYIDGAWVIAK